MDCPSDEQIAAFVEGDAPEAAASALREHLLACEACSEVVAEYAAAFGLASASCAFSVEEPAAAPRAGALDLNEGDLFGRYVVLMPAGRGGMGEVYVAYDPELDRKLALKIVRPTSGRATASRQERLLAEARLAAALSHENVVEVFDVGTERGRAFIAMEYVDGQPLSRWLDGARTVDEIVDAFVAAARGLQAAHDAGIVHRDFKPANVLVGRDGRVRVVDFGLARARADASATGVSGTPGYMAPEQWRAGEVDARADQYALCVALHEALFGEHRGGTGLSPTRRDEASDSGSTERAPARPRVRHQDRKLAAIARVLQRGMSRQPDARWSSITALVDALPRRRSATVFSWLAAAAAIGLGTTLVLAGPADAAAPGCDGQRVLAASWGEGQRAGVRAGILATGAVYAEPTAEATTRALDAWATEWIAAHDEACAAERPQVLRCLQRARAELDATTAILSDADPEVAGRALAVAQGLPVPAECDAVRGSDEPTAWPREVERVEADIAENHALRRAGRYAQAHQRMPEILAAAEATGDRATMARALYSAGVLERHADPDTAAQRLERAAWLASQVRDDTLQMRALTGLVGVEGMQRDHPELSRKWAERARALLVRAGNPPALQLPLAQAEGAVAALRGDDEEAIADLTRAVELAERIRGADSMVASHASHALGIALLGVGRLDEARTASAHALAIREQQLGEVHPLVANALDVLMAIERAAGDLDAMLSHARRAHAIREAVYGRRSMEFAIAEQHLGLALDEVGDAHEADAHLRAAVALMDEVGGPTRPELISALDALAVLEYRTGLLDDAEANLRRALALAEDHGRVLHPATAAAWGHLGDVLRLLERFDEARAAVLEGKRIREALGRPHEVAASLDSLGRIAEAQGDSAAARELYLQAADMFAEALGPEHVWAVQARQAAAALDPPAAKN